MCGIAGFARFRGLHEDAAAEIRAMCAALSHRGPDAEGCWLDGPVALGHRRLSIIDLSDAGRQPMFSACGRYAMVFNGEIYNFQALRRELEREGVQFRSMTDSEVLLELYARDGARCVERLNGMFAFCVYDRVTERLFLARDRIGKKPLYYWWDGSNFAFASELKALLRLPWVPRELRLDAMIDYFHLQYVPDPKTIFAGVSKLPPAATLTVDRQAARTDVYWDVSFANQNDAIGAEDAAGELLVLLRDAVRQRLVSDVPLGAFLSGGVDSSGIVALMAEAADKPVTTCSVGFDSAEFDEVAYAREVAQRFGCEHFEFTARDTVEDRLAEILATFDEPFADPSLVPTYFVSELARRTVTVALSGDGGDENFAGYSKYEADRQERRLRRLCPPWIRERVLPGLIERLGTSGHRLAGRAASGLAGVAASPGRAFFLTNSAFNPFKWRRLVRGELAATSAEYDPADGTIDLYRRADTDDHLSRLLYTDLHGYLPGDILVKVDRASMAHGLEMRAPILDYRVIEFAATLPSRLKLAGRDKKHVLKRALGGLLPNDVLYRPKQGFSPPLAQWMRQELFATARSALLDRDAAVAEWFDRKVMAAMFDAHAAGRADHAYELWSLMVFELWWRRYAAPAER